MFLVKRFDDPSQSRERLPQSEKLKKLLAKKRIEPKGTGKSGDRAIVEADRGAPKDDKNRGSINWKKGKESEKHRLHHKENKNHRGKVKVSLETEEESPEEKKKKKKKRKRKRDVLEDEVSTAFSEEEEAGDRFGTKDANQDKPQALKGDESSNVKKVEQRKKEEENLLEDVIEDAAYHLFPDSPNGKEVEGDAKIEEDEDEYQTRPMLEMAKEWGLDERLVQVLREEGIEYFFPIQQQVIPDIIASEKAYHVQQRDICFSAPTGSGKTLVFVLGVLQALSRRRVCRLRALVLLPGRDLATQVFEVFHTYAEAVGLKVGLATGQSDFLEEQKILVGPDLLAADPSIGALLKGEFRSDQLGGDLQARLPLSGGHSEIDVLVATPGRLMDHIEKTPGFTLQHLRYLVIDEADRLLNQSYQDWVTKVYSNAYQQKHIGDVIEHNDEALRGMENRTVLNATTVRARPFVASSAGLPVALLGPAPLRKMLSSATLTTSPEKLAALGLVHPRVYSLQKPSKKQDGKDQQECYQLPKGLSEKLFICSAEQKPLLLIYLLQSMAKSSLVVIFTSSVDTTHRLARLLQLYGGFHGDKPPAEFSGALNQKQRNKLIKQCKNGKVKVLVSSDGMARGMDIPEVDHVINYDMPLNPRTYVHRVGRTARAGRSGTSITLLKPGQEHVFHRMHSGIQSTKKAERCDLPTENLDSLQPKFKMCLGELEEVIKNERAGRQLNTAPLTPWKVKIENDAGIKKKS